MDYQQEYYRINVEGYAINPDKCKTCKYKGYGIANCDYISIKNKMRPKENSTYNHCEAYEKADPKELKSRLKMNSQIKPQFG